MSNLLRAITFLKSSPENRFLVISDENGTTVGVDKTYLNSIPNENLEAYLKLHLGSQDKDVLVWIEAREKIGVTDKKRGSFPVRIDAEVQPVQPVQNLMQIQQPMQHSTTALGQAVQSQESTMLISTSLVMDMQRKADRLDDANERIAELRKELQEVKNKRDSEALDHKNKRDSDALDHKKERNDLDTELRELRSKLQTAEREKDIAVKEIKNDTKSFFDSPAVSKFMEKAPEMLGNVIAMKTGIPQTGESLGAASNLSEPKQMFMEVISNEMTDEQVNYLASLCHFLPNEIFMSELKQLIIKHHVN